MISRFAISTCTARYGRYIPIRQVTGTWTASYQTVPPKIDRQRSIQGEIDRRRSIEEEKGKKKEEKKKKEEEKKEYHAVAARARWSFLSRTRRRNVSPHGEKDRGDIAPFPFFQIF
ncbi:hypothetical protein GW17_00035283 [Ensete ventricosum]|nr:hypothetical protein GW17_00035283 [Ensete ventricosum]RZR81340.1 hypothetical protein BHM03_00007545 [Ensete ventricosum]